MEVLITGADGFIGSHTMLEVAKRGHNSIPFDLPVDSILDVENLERAVGRADAVINLAGVLGTSETFGSERNVAEVNILGALNVAAACRDAGIPMVQVGTGHRGQPNPYAITKACAEDLIMESAVDANLVRAYHAYGPGQTPVAPHGASEVRKIIPTFVCRALTNMPLEINGSGQQYIDLVYAREVARVVVNALSEPFGRTLEAGTGQGITVNEVAEYVQQNVAPVDIVHIPMRQGEPEDTVVVARKPECENAFPYKMEGTIDYYRNLLQGV